VGLRKIKKGATMIREFPETENMQINVFLKSGKTFMNKDIPSNCMEMMSRTITFWDDEKLKVYPIESIEHLEITYT
jgi:hypothetical protein